jgi:hypothetical protein
MNEVEARSGSEVLERLGASSGVRSIIHELWWSLGRLWASGGAVLMTA